MTIASLWLCLRLPIFSLLLTPLRLYTYVGLVLRDRIPYGPPLTVVLLVLGLSCFVSFLHFLCCVP